MKLRKVISGGQTGADQQGLIEAQKMNLETGGWVPKGWRTEDGAAHWLEMFGCKEHESSSYPPRTYANVRDSEATLWFGNIGSPGYLCTHKAAMQYSRAWYVNPTADLMRQIAETYEVVNIAGNRASKNPQVNALVTEAFHALVP